jgi:predicted nucleotidyltransferase
MTHQRIGNLPLHRARFSDHDPGVYVSLAAANFDAIKRSSGAKSSACCCLTGEKVNRDQTLRLLAEHKADLTRRFGVVDLALFGSTVRGDERVDSDIDILVSFDGPSTSQRYFGVQFYLEDLLGRPVDLVTRKALRRELAPYVEREAIRV